MRSMHNLLPRNLIYLISHCNKSGILTNLNANHVGSNQIDNWQIKSWKLLKSWFKSNCISDLPISK